ncbi:MAG: hypothetical protein [Caudoviricetes sp.]|nr:MAG: hypothetical protein [Caudoviricetes sp.]
MKLSQKRIQIGNAVNVELIEMTERALSLLGHIDDTNIDSFVEHFYSKDVIKNLSIGRGILREHIVQLILSLPEFGVEAFGIKPVVEPHESTNPKGSTGRGKN